MESSQKYPNLFRYCYAWDWLVQFRVHKPKKQKKEWIDWIEVIGANADDAPKALGFLCERKGWKLLEAYYLKPTAIAFAFDRDAPDTGFLTREQKQQLIPRPAPRGREYCLPTPAQRQQARQAEREAQRQQHQRQKITAAFPLLAADFSQAA